MYTVKQARLLRGKTQDEVAKEMGICRSTYMRIELEPEKITIEQAKKVCKVLNFSVNEIFFDEISTFSRQTQ